MEKESNSMDCHYQGMGLGDLNCFLNLNWDNSMMGGGGDSASASALSSMVSSPPITATNSPTTTTNNSLVIRELIGRLGSICNNSSSDPPNPNLDPGFYERAARLSQFNPNEKLSRVSSSQSLLKTRSCTPDNNNAESSAASKPNFKETRKRKSSSKTTNKDKVEDEDNKDEDNSKAAKRSKPSETEKEKPVEPPKDYIHVRARRGQATDSHSLAERVRREKISERMKFLQDLVPGCNKVTGKAVMLDEIINYVQSLQRQVEFLSMKLATVNPRMEVSMESLLSKDIPSSSPLAIHQADAFHYSHHLPSLNNSGITNGTETHYSVNQLEAAQRLNLSMQLPPLDGFGDGDSQLAAFWEDDLQSIVQMGFGQNQTFQGMKVEL